MQRSRIDNLTSLRFFAAFSVFLHHSTPLGIDFSQYVWGVSLGWTVSFFYVLSGFVLSFSREGRTFDRGDIGIFIAERFFRLWPLHVVCGLIALSTLGTFGGTNGSFTQFFLFFTLQHSWTPGYSTAFFINGVSWSISVEWFFYIVFPFLISKNVKTLIIVSIIWTAVVYGFMTFVSWNPGFVQFTPASVNILAPGITESSFFHLFPPVRIVEFFAGMLVYQLYKRVRMPQKFILPAQIACILLTLFYMMNFRNILMLSAEWMPRVVAYNQAHYGMFPLFSLLVYVFAHQNGAVSRALAVRPLVYLGEISFSLYMVHQLVITNLYLNTTVKDVIGPAASVLLALAISLVASALLFEAIEKPSLAFAKRRLNAGKARHASLAPA